jgi:hypothetical protein
MAPLPSAHLKSALILSFFLAGCSDDSGGANENTGGTGMAGGATGGASGAAGTAGTATGGSGGTMVVPTPEGTLFMDDFETGSTKWTITQGTCMIAADETSVLNCINGGNEARAYAGEVWGEYSVQARVKLNAMDPDRRVYLAGRFTDSNNWYGAAIYNHAPMQVQLRKKVAGTSSDIVEGPYAFELGTWYTLKLELKGSTLTLSVNDVIQLQTDTDTQFSSGKIALLVDRSDVSWDDVLVTNP